MTRDARIDEINAELNRMDDTLSGCDWCAECGGGETVYYALLDELRDLEGAYIRVCKQEDGTVELSPKFDFRVNSTLR
jgi:hypothetical protein